MIDPYKQGLCGWSVSVCKQMCKQIRGFKGSASSLFGFQNQRIFGATIYHLVAPKCFFLMWLSVAKSNTYYGLEVFV